MRESTSVPHHKVFPGVKDVLIRCRGILEVQNLEPRHELQAVGNDGGSGGAEGVGTAASESAFQHSQTEWHGQEVLTNKFGVIFRAHSTVPNET